ncbi:hypothetical protein A2415_02040 [candidate division WWE3 bacterium RIFOXYC1_FULL_39_7]|uniref:phenylalanine--tRNA ligase n=2 Tax=Katanobacteria TaxID=422282 RepID=A0A1F4X8V1_UNCKA|nr:MAG: hypothetical protein A2415_02040 [candidate division WWE3 bacterium RIFOXYC1_FULL_39_7]OGC78117.1 MAG: hypothetical protein A2619_05190 [candidate division WWE3 bacterium RIFOXYD1_FULL_39_9]
MKIPVEWLKEYIDLDKTPAEIAKSFTTIGLMLDKPIIKYSKGNFSTEVLDLEHRMDRADWLSILGCSRDLAAFEKTTFKMPEIYSGDIKKPSKEQIVDIKVECPDLVNRFNTRTFKKIKVGRSPDWLKNRLESYGISSINNIVDITNYVMVETGQPMHAQDLSKFQKREILIRKAIKGEKITTLLGETIELTEEYFVLTQNGMPIVLGGIVGGKDTAVDEHTAEIVLDAGNYNQVNIRKSSRRAKIQNETVLRYDKFLHPKLTEIAIERATKLILELAGGEVYENVDWYPKETPERIMNLRFARIKTLSGMDIPLKEVESILSALGYVTAGSSKESMSVTVPYFRTDVEVEDDIVADVLRIHDYNNIPTVHLDIAPPKDITPEIYLVEEQLRDICKNLGFHEHITDPLVEPDPKNDKQIKLENAISQEKSALRTEMYTSLAKVAESYTKNKIKTSYLFELGKTYEKQGSGNDFADYNESRVLQVLIGGDELTAKEKAKTTKRVLASIMRDFGITPYAIDVTGDMNIVMHENVVLGEIKYDSFFLYTEALKNAKGIPNRIQSEYKQTKTEDISVVMPKTTPVGPVFWKIKEIDEKIGSITCIPEELDTIIGEKNKNVLFKINYSGDNFAETREKIIVLINSLGMSVRELSSIANDL